MRRALPLLVLLAAAPAFSGPGAPAAPSAGRFKSAADLERRLQETSERLDRLVAKAHQDPRIVRVERYLSWSTADDFANPKRDVHVTDLIDFIADEDAPIELREMSRDALKSPMHRSLDPDLEYSASKSKRGAFSLARVVPLLGSRAKGLPGGDTSRAFAAEILDAYWHHTQKAIQLYNPKDPATWPPAIAEWKKFLAGR